MNIKNLYARDIFGKPMEVSSQQQGQMLIACSIKMISNTYKKSAELIKSLVK